MTSRVETLGPSELRTAQFISLANVLAWRPNSRPQDKYCKASVPLHETCTVLNPLARAIETDTSDEDEIALRRKLLVCHDYGAGWLEDRYYQGFCRKETFFQIFNWDLIQSFVFFTHDRLSVPPPGWTNLAHKHGSKVLGTFLVEGEPGDDGYKDCIQFLQSAQIQSRLIDQLIQICQYFGFEGYLLNIEVDLKELENAKELVQMLLVFVDKLTKQLRAAVPNAEALWYDSITCRSADAECGELKWQNCLSDANRPFFDRSDGMLINYFWKKETIAEDYRRSRPRNLDIYKGIDVFARGTPAYSAGLGCVSAMADIQESALSCGLFAPGYFHQDCPSDRRPSDYSAQFWTEVRKIWKSVHLQTQLPFLSNFCTGEGNSRFMNGKRISIAPWFDLSFQDILPTRDYRYVYNVGFNGGGCLFLESKGRSDIGHHIERFPLFDTRYQLRDYRKLYVSAIHATNASFAIYLQLGRECQRTIVISSSIVLGDLAAVRENDNSWGDCRFVSGVTEVVGSSDADGIVVYPSSSLPWKRLSAEIELQWNGHDVITSIGVICSGAVHLGQIALFGDGLDCTDSLPPSITATHLKITPDDASGIGSLFLNCQLEWSSQSNHTAVFMQSISTKKTPTDTPLAFLGCTASKSGYWIKKCRIGTDVIRCIIQLRSLASLGKWTAIGDSPICVIPIER